MYTETGTIIADMENFMNLNGRSRQGGGGGSEVWGW